MRNQPLTVIFFPSTSKWHFNIHIISRYVQSHSSVNKFYIKNFPPIVRVAILLLKKTVFSNTIFLSLWVGSNKFLWTTEEKLKVCRAQNPTIIKLTWHIFLPNHGIKTTLYSHNNHRASSKIKICYILQRPLKTHTLGRGYFLKFYLWLHARKSKSQWENMRNCIFYVRGSKWIQHIFLLHILVM